MNLAVIIVFQQKKTTIRRKIRNFKLNYESKNKKQGNKGTAKKL